MPSVPRARVKRTLQRPTDPRSGVTTKRGPKQANSSANALSFLGGLSAEQFLSRHWQKQPLLVRGAVRNYTSPVSPEELAGLACEREVESRVVVFDGTTWELEQGPFKARSFPKRGAKNWTLLVQDLDEHVPEVGKLLSHLNFLPRFRVDDIMASFAAPGGSVGPHYDEYDVFLLQVEGSRRWQVTSAFDRTALRTDSQLKILEHFVPDQEWVLEPGDLLYLPPHVAHFGVATTPCMTFSLGCRAPSQADLVAHMAGMFLSELDEGRRYTDHDLQLDEHASMISPRAIGRVCALLNEVWQVTPDLAARCLGAVSTTPKLLFRQDDEPAAWSERDLSRVLTSKRPLFRRKGSRWSWHQGVQLYLFVDGREYTLAASTATAANLAYLCDNRKLDWSWRNTLDDGSCALVEELVRRGQLSANE
jgi:50S ribosomal protein L16 3-hydroxylase